MTREQHQRKLEAARAYLASRGKLLADPGCKFHPTPATDRFSILVRYGRPAALEEKR
jgi:hypothetical protein